MNRRPFIFIYILLIAALLCACTGKEKNVPDPDSINIYITNSYSGRIESLAISCTADGQLLSTLGTVHANHTPFAAGEILRFELPRETFRTVDISCLEIEVYAGVEAGQDTTFCGTAAIISPAFGSVYHYELQGSDGIFSLSEKK